MLVLGGTAVIAALEISPKFKKKEKFIGRGVCIGYTWGCVNVKILSTVHCDLVEPTCKQSNHNSSFTEKE